jgi:predicted pyridoxine 5'-phosphate oxidase superfamily flavin-nucleotide-binding protein
MTVHAVDFGFHDGERAVQERAGVGVEAARLEGMLAPASLSGGLSTFLAARALAVLVGRDDDGRLWASPLVGRPGFLRGRGDTLEVGEGPEDGDPLRDLPAGQAVGLIAPDLGRRRRVRINGWLAASDRDGLRIDVAEAYGNCPAYITARAVDDDQETPTGTVRPAVNESGALTPAAARIVTSADTCFLGTQHPQRGADASHKGGKPGFVLIDGADLLWPDYAGNNMFNSLGNLAVDPDAAVLFVDFEAGDVLQLSGTAEIEWRPADEASADTGRWVRFRPERGVLRTSGVRGRGRLPHRDASSR